MPKVNVLVELRAETEVELEVNVKAGDSPTDLTPEELTRAKYLARLMPVDWEVVDVKKLCPPSGCAELCWNEECRKAGRCEG